jgi:hypothetical protein
MRPSCAEHGQEELVTVVVALVTVAVMVSIAKSTQALNDGARLAAFAPDEDGFCQMSPKETPPVSEAGAPGSWDFCSECFEQAGKELVNKMQSATRQSVE